MSLLQRHGKLPTQQEVCIHWPRVTDGSHSSWIRCRLTMFSFRSSLPPPLGQPKNCDNACLLAKTAMEVYIYTHIDTGFTSAQANTTSPKVATSTSARGSTTVWRGKEISCMATATESTKVGPPISIGLLSGAPQFRNLHVANRDTVLTGTILTNALQIGREVSTL